MAEVQIIGDDIFYDNTKVAVLTQPLETTPRVGFCSLLEKGLDEEALAEKINDAECEAEADGKRSTLESINEWIAQTAHDGGDFETALNEKLDELEKEI